MNKNEKSIGEIFGNNIEVNIENKIILGIDPGLKFLGIGIIEADISVKATIKMNKKKTIDPLSLIPFVKNYTHFFLKIKSHRDTSKKLYFIYTKINEIIERYKPNLIVIEDSFVGINKNSAIKLGLARGCILTAVGKYSKKVEMVPPKKIKMEITENGTSTKEEIQQFFQKNFKNWQNCIKLDATDALAAAFCGLKMEIPDLNIKNLEP